jgi:hypothetical protein
MYYFAKAKTDNVRETVQQEKSGGWKRMEMVAILSTFRQSLCSISWLWHSLGASDWSLQINPFFLTSLKGKRCKLAF